MTVDRAEVLSKVVEKLSRMIPPELRSRPITEDTEIYRDLGIYGDEIVDLVWWLEKEFGLETNINPFKYAPREFPFFRAWRAIGRTMGLETTYKSLKVRDILAAVEVKRWPDEASS
jgi:hypothetical protein